MEISVSSHEAENKAIKKEMQNGKILHLSKNMFPSSEWYLTKAPSYSEGPDLVPTSNNISSDSKDKPLSSNKQEVGTESFEKELSDTIDPSGKKESHNTDNQGNPIDESGKLILEPVESIEAITDADFLIPQRNVELPILPDNVSTAIGSQGRNVIIKKSIFIKNRDTHNELSPEDSRDILKRALYNPNIIGNNQPIRRPDYRVVIQTGGKNAVVVLDMYAAKDNVEIVGWRRINAKGLERMKKQATREGGQFLILSPNDGSAAALSALPSGVPSKVTDANLQQNFELASSEVLGIDQKEKVQSIIDSLRMNPGEAERIGLNLDDVANIVERFENPTIEEEKTKIESSKEDRIKELSGKLGVPITIISDKEEIDKLPSDRHRRAKGWWSNEGGVVVVLPNNADVADVENTVVHEVVGHKGLHVLVGKDKMDDFLNEIYEHAAAGITQQIDESTQRLVDKEADRLTIEKGGGVFAAAEARVEAERKREQFRREATEEYMADMAGRIGDSGFEKMSLEELTLWGRIKAKVQQFLDKFLRGLNIAKSIRLNDKDLAYILYKSWKNMRTTGVFAEAEDIVRSRGTRFSDNLRNPEWKEKVRALTATKKPTQEETFNAPKGSRMTHQKDAALDSRSESDVAKVVKICSSLKNLEENISEEGLGKAEMVYQIASALGVKDASSSKSNYEVVTMNGIGMTTLRISSHSADVSNFDSNSNNVGIVIKTSGHRFSQKADIDYVEFLYYGDHVENNAALQRKIIGGLRRYIETGAFDGIPEPDRLNTSGMYRNAIEGIEDMIRFRDPQLELEEVITRMKVEAMKANDSLKTRLDVMAALGENLSHLRQAMSWQKKYDITTVKSVTDLARVLMDAGLFDDISKYETKRILGAINNVVGKQDVSQDVQKVLDIMVDNQLRMGANDFGRILSKGRGKVNDRGIAVAGVLDPDGQRIIEVAKKAISFSKDEIDARIDEATDRMNNTDAVIADNATLEYSGLLIARQYGENIADSKADEKWLRDSIKLAKEDKDAGAMTNEAYREFVSATEDAIRQNKIERAQAYNELIEQLGGMMTESAARAKAWRDGERYRIAEIHHNANSDMEGRPTDEHHKDTRIQKFANNNIARFVLAPLGTFDQMLRMFGNKSVNGEGYLWNRYMRGWTEATEKEYTGYRDCLKELDAKVSDVFGRKMKWGDLISMERGMKKATVSFMDGGKIKEHQLTQGNLLYIYMVDKMNDGRMKLRRMGIEQDDVDNIRKMLDPRFIELADWMQEEFLVEKRNKYNEVHKRMFGASMSAIENYFPLKILANARLEKVDVADDTTDTALPATATGSIIKRTRNNLALDITGADAFSVVLDHVQEMERWAAFAEFNRDLNTLLSYKHFRNQVMNMSSVYGGGKTLWNNFRNVCSMAAGAYRPPIAALDKSAVNIAKGVTAAKVSFRMFTALKQFLSMPAYLSDSNPIYLATNIATPVGAWRWTMKELPLFEKRWQSRMSGDPRLMKSEMDWKMWRNRAVEIASRIGMSPNAFVDAVTVSIGAHSMYQTRRDKYLRQGYSKPVAEKRAKQDATILFNQTQQSSENAFLSTMQIDRSWLSVLFTVFRNSSMSYTRQLYDALRNLKRKGVPGYKSLTEEFMTKQMIRDGIDPDKANKNARREYRQSILRDIARVGVFGYALQLAWNLGAYLPYLFLGSDEDEKDTMLNDVVNHTMFGSIEGLTGGDVMSSAGQMWLNGEGNMSYLVKDMPIASDLSSIFKKWSKDEVSAMNDVINILAQIAVGVNPQSLTDAVVAVMDFCGDDANTSKECALLIARILNCPPSQLDKIYFDELGVDGIEASKMTPAEIAERYAEYKTLRNAPLTSGLYSAEQKDSVMTTYRKKAQKIAKENLERRMTSDALKELMEQYDKTKAIQKELTKLRKEHPEEYRDRYEAVRDSMDMRLYRLVGRYRQDIKSLTEEWLKTTDVAERDSLAAQMRETRDVLLEEVNE